MKKLTFWQILKISARSISFNPDPTILDALKVETKFTHTPEYLALMYSIANPEVKKNIIEGILVYLYKNDKMKFNKVSDIIVETGNIISIEKVLTYLKDDEKTLSDISDLIRKKYFRAIKP